MFEKWEGYRAGSLATLNYQIPSIGLLTCLSHQILVKIHTNIISVFRFVSKIYHNLKAMDRMARFCFSSFYNILTAKIFIIIVNDNMLLYSGLSWVFWQRSDRLRITSEIMSGAFWSMPDQIVIQCLYLVTLQSLFPRVCTHFVKTQRFHSKKKRKLPNSCRTLLLTWGFSETRYVISSILHRVFSNKI